MAGKGSARRKGSDDTKYRNNHDRVFSKESNKFEEVFMQKTADEVGKPLNGKYFIDED